MKKALFLTSLVLTAHNAFAASHGQKLEVLGRFGITGKPAEKVAETVSRLTKAMETVAGNITTKSGKPKSLNNARQTLKDIKRNEYVNDIVAHFDAKQADGTLRNALEAAKVKTLLKAGLPLSNTREAAREITKIEKQILKNNGQLK